MEQFTVLFRGAAIGTLRGQMTDDLCGGELAPLPGFDAIRGVIADAPHARW